MLKLITINRKTTMQTYISMLRGINVGTQKRIKMEVLKDLYESLNFKFIKIYLQTGNILFQNQHTPASSLANKIESKIKEVLGLEVPVLIKDIDELQQVIQHNPFRKEEPNKVYVTFLFGNTSPEILVNEIERVKGESEAYYMAEKEIYLYCPYGYGVTKLSNNFFEKKLNLYATTRNLNTLNKLLYRARS